MVILQIKGKSELDQFVYEAPSAESMDKISTEVGEVWNLRLKLKWYITCAKDLATRVNTEMNATSSSNSSTSIAVENQIKKTTNDAEEFLQQLANPTSKLRVMANTSNVQSSSTSTSEGQDSKDQEAADQKPKTLLQMLQEHIQLIRAAVTMHFPRDATVSVEQLNKEMASLEIDEPSRLQKQQIVHVRSDDPEMADMKELVDPKTCQLWFSGKQMYRDKPLSTYSGKNEKTKLLCKIGKAGQGAPAREPPLDAQAQKEMMAYWYKRQEEQKRLEKEEQEDITYGNSDWADPNALKSTFQGLKKDIKFR